MISKSYRYLVVTFVQLHDLAHLVASAVRLEQHQPRFKLLVPAPRFVPSPNFLYLNGGCYPLEIPLHQVHPAVRLYGDDGGSDPEEFPAFQAGPEPTLQNYDARHDLLVELAVQLVLFAFSQENLADSELIIVAVQVEGGQKVADVVLRTEQPLRQQDPIQLYELVVGQADVEAGLPDPDGLQHSCVPQLSLDRLVVELVRDLVGVGLDAADEKRIRLV